MYEGELLNESHASSNARRFGKLWCWIKDRWTVGSRPMTDEQCTGPTLDGTQKAELAADEEENGTPASRWWKKKQF
jgi:hypothetical protein